MPTTITAMPARPDTAGTATVPADGGRLQAAWDTIHQSGSWAKIPKQGTRNEHAEYRNRSAWMTYGIRPANVVLPQADPLGVRLRLKRFNSDTADRQANIRLLVRDIAAADPHRSGLRAARARERLSWQAKSRPAEVAEAHQLVGHFDQLRRGISSRVAGHRMTSDAFGVLSIGYSFALLAMGFAPHGPHFRVWQVVLASLIAMVCVFHIGRERGWKYGYDQATWHCAEARVDLAKVETETQADKIERIRQQAARAERDAKAALAKLKALHAEERRAHNELEQARSTSLTAFKRLVKTRKMGFKLPRQPHGEGYVYVVGFDTGTVKVGMTEDPKSRLATHRNDAAKFGVHVTNYWISVPHTNFRGNETRLINRCTRVSPRSRKEYFHEVGYVRAVEFASDLTCFSADTSHTAVEGVWA